MGVVIAGTGTAVDSAVTSSRTAPTPSGDPGGLVTLDAVAGGTTATIRLDGVDENADLGSTSGRRLHFWVTEQYDTAAARVYTSTTQRALAMGVVTLAGADPAGIVRAGLAFHGSGSILTIPGVDPQDVDGMIVAFGSGVPSAGTELPDLPAGWSAVLASGGSSGTGDAALFCVARPLPKGDSYGEFDLEMQGSGQWVGVALFVPAGGHEGVTLEGLRTAAETADTAAHPAPTPDGAEVGDVVLTVATTGAPTGTTMSGDHAALDYQGVPVGVWIDRAYDPGHDRTVSTGSACVLCSVGAVVVGADPSGASVVGVAATQSGADAGLPAVPAQDSAGLLVAVVTGVAEAGDTAPSGLNGWELAAATGASVGTGASTLFVFTRQLGGGESLPAGTIDGFATSGSWAVTVAFLPEVGEGGPTIRVSIVDSIGLADSLAAGESGDLARRLADRLTIGEPGAQTVEVDAGHADRLGLHDRLSVALSGPVTLNPKAHDRLGLHDRLSVVLVGPPPVEVKPRPAGAWLTWTGGDGRTIGLSDESEGRRVLQGVLGLDAAPVVLWADDSPSLDGGIYRGGKAAPRDVTIPLALLAADRAALVARKRELVRALSPRSGPGVLEVAEPDGTRRRLTQVRYVSGAEGSEAPDAAGLWWQRYVVMLRAFDPWWYAADDVTATWRQPGSGLFLGDPFLPFTLLADQSLGEITVDNVGDVEAFPRWRVEGPATQIVLERGDGATLDLTHTLTSGQWVEVDTRPGVLTVVDDGGANLWPGLSAGSALWSLPPGESQVTLTVAGADPSTRVRLAYSPRFLAA